MMFLGGASVRKSLKIKQGLGKYGKLIKCLKWITCSNLLKKNKKNKCCSWLKFSCVLPQAERWRNYIFGYWWRSLGTAVPSSQGGLAILSEDETPPIHSTSTKGSTWEIQLHPFPFLLLLLLYLHSFIYLLSKVKHLYTAVKGTNTNTHATSLAL